MKTLTDSQIHDFNENGYLLLEDALVPDDLNPLITEFEEIVDAGASELYAEGEIDSEFKTEGLTPVWRKLRRNPQSYFRRCLAAHTQDRHSSICSSIRSCLTSPSRSSDQRLCVIPHIGCALNFLNTIEPSFRGIRMLAIWSRNAIQCYNSRSGFH